MRTDSLDTEVTRPAELTVAAVALAGQGLLITAWGVASLALAFTGQSQERVQVITLGVTVVVLALLPLAAARGLWRLRRWGRGPAMVVQLMALPVTWQLVQSGGLRTVGGIALGGTALTVLVLLLRPRVTDALGVGPSER